MKTVFSSGTGRASAGQAQHRDADEVQGAAIHRVTDAGGVEAAAGFSSGDSAGGGE